jgi:hypothetical protein
MQSHITPAELDALQTSALSRDTPYLIQAVSYGQLSLARHYGGIKFNGAEYFYLPLSDELIRGDVVSWLKKHRKANKPVVAAAEQLPLLD